MPSPEAREFHIKPLGLDDRHGDRPRGRQRGRLERADARLLSPWPRSVFEGSPHHEPEEEDDADNHQAHGPPKVGAARAWHPARLALRARRLVELGSRLHPAILRCLARVSDDIPQSVELGYAGSYGL